MDIEGNLQKPWMSKARLENEHATLNYISTRTTIPVPKPLGLGHVDGCLAMTTEWIDGVPFDELPDRVRSTVYLDGFVQDFVLPQLKALTSRTIGALMGVILPPRRVIDTKPQGQWFSRTSSKEEYHFAHNDLSQHNFLCDRETGKVKVVIDWEFAGFYPSCFEAPLWRTPYHAVVEDPDEIQDLLTHLKPTAEVSSL